MIKLSRRCRWLLAIFAALIFFFLFAPILVVFPLSFNGAAYLTWPPEGFSLRWYKTFFEQQKWMIATLNSLKLAFVVTIVSLTLGTMGAYGISRMKGVLKTSLYMLFILPMIIPAIILALAYYFGFANIGIKRSMFTVAVAHCIIAIPYVVSSVSAALSNFDWNTQRASLSLGANPVRTFWSVILPAIQPSMIAGALFAFITSFDEVVIAQFISGTSFTTLPMEMFGGIKHEIHPTIASAASMLVILSIVLQGCSQIINNRREAKFTGKAKKKITRKELTV